MSHCKFILASSSKRRASVLAQIGYVPDMVVPADIDETPLNNERPRALAIRLATGKALKIASFHKDDIVLGADTVVAVGNTILPKGETEEDAVYSIDKLSGKKHRVYTGVCLIHSGRIIKKVSMTVVKFKVLSDYEKEEFLKTKQWYGKAGCYALQGFAAQFVEKMSGVDTNILGLPACMVHKLLHGIGVKQDYTVSTELC